MVASNNSKFVQYFILLVKQFQIKHIMLFNA